MNQDEVSCIDEGIDFGKVRVAGSGILHPGGISAAAELFRAAGVRKITTHGECGAAKAAFVKKYGREPNPNELDDFAKEWGEALAKKMELPHEFIPISKMKRPAGHHPARRLYYDERGDFDPKGKPQGFVVSRKWLDREHSLENVKIALSIAFGEHGLGKEITEDEPFEILVIGTGDPELKDVAAEYGKSVKKVLILRKY